MRTLFCALALLCGSSVLWAHDEECPQCGAKVGPVERPGLLLVGNTMGQTITLSPEQFAALPQTKVEAKTEDGATLVYEGVPLGVLLQQAGVRFEEICRKPTEGPHLLSTYVLVDAADGYRTAFSIPEVEPNGAEPPVLVARRKNGQPLGSAGPYQIIEPQSKYHGRWVRQVARILVRPIEAASGHADTSHADTSHADTSHADTSHADTLPQASELQHVRQRGRLYLVGIGPGDPQLVTVRASQVLRDADRVYCYHWLKDEVLAWAHSQAVVVASPLLIGGQFIGREPAEVEASQRERVRQTNHAFEQFRNDVREMLQAGKTVAVAAAGDPTIYSPWGWIPEQLAALDPTVVPGISSFNAGNAALKHGAVGASYYMLSAGRELPAPDASGRLSGVVVLFTHTSKFLEQVSRLREKYPADTPLAIVCDASYPTERVFQETLGTVLAEVDVEKLPHLYLIYVGDGLQRKHNAR